MRGDASSYQSDFFQKKISIFNALELFDAFLKHLMYLLPRHQLHAILQFSHTRVTDLVTKSVYALSNKINSQSSKIGGARATVRWRGKKALPGPVATALLYYIQYFVL